MMTEYIAKEQALRIIYTAFEGTNYMEDAWAYCTQKLRALPSADVAPVVHGKWIGIWGDGYAETDDGSVEIVYEEFECSNCGCVHHSDGEPVWDYCPECGARMDGDEE